MILRPLPRTLRQRQLQPSNLTPACTTCICRYGAPIPPPSASPQKQQRRNYAVRRSPARLTGRRVPQERGPLTPAQAREARARHAAYEGWARGEIGALSRLGWIHSSGDGAMQFLAAFKKLMDASVGQNSVPPEQFVKLLLEHSISAEDALTMAKILLRDSIPQNLYQGKKLLYSLSRTGMESSTIEVMAHAYLEAERKPQALKAREIAVSREHLTQIANSEVREGNFRAMVLEGKIALRLGNEEYAIKMLRKAMSAAVVASEKRLANPNTKDQDVAKDLLELTSPWIELMETHLHRSEHKGLDEWKDFEWAMEIGCEQDDPLAHKFAADYTKRMVVDGTQDVHIGTSEWLYHITKAAASNVPAAMHDLGVFYSESGWKYIEDEPPDHVKPTPFDSYPASKPVTLLWDTLHMFGLKRKQFTPKEKIFYSAAFPHTAVDRQKMAIGWLKQVMAMSYAPSYLYIARLYNRRTLWAPATAPSDAIALRESRYSFASKQDYEARRPISEEAKPEEDDPPNPLYDPEKAKLYLREVFHAYEAYRWGEEMKRFHERAWRSGEETRPADDDNLLDERDMVQRGLPSKLGKWFKYPEVRAMNAKKMKHHYQEAKSMCEEEGWVLTDEDGGLVYKAGMKEKPFFLVEA